nr:MAG TPA: hypothetical protein [Caudoviricetes sp.]
MIYPTPWCLLNTRNSPINDSCLISFEYITTQP